MTIIFMFLHLAPGRTSARRMNAAIENLPEIQHRNTASTRDAEKYIHCGPVEYNGTSSKPEEQQTANTDEPLDLSLPKGTKNQKQQNQQISHNPPLEPGEIASSPVAAEVLSVLDLSTDNKYFLDQESFITLDQYSRDAGEPNATIRGEVTPTRDEPSANPLEQHARGTRESSPAGQGEATPTQDECADDPWGIGPKAAANLASQPAEVDASDAPWNGPNDTDPNLPSYSQICSAIQKRGHWSALPGQSKIQV